MAELTMLKAAGTEPTFKERILDVIAERRRWLKRKLHGVSLKRNPEMETSYWGGLLQELEELDAAARVRL